MAASVRFEAPTAESGKAGPSPAAHRYPLRSHNPQSSKLVGEGQCQREGKQLRMKKVQRRKRVKTRKCGDISVHSRRGRVTIRPSAIQQQEFTVPSFHKSSPTKVVIKTNPLFHSTSPQQATPPDRAGTENGGVGQRVFYGQRRNIRKTKEQEMISAVINLGTGHSEPSAKKRTTSLFQKIRNLKTRKGMSKISHYRGNASRSSNTNQLHQMLTQI